MTIDDIPLGIYEKALPKGLSWHEMLSMAGRQHYTFVEMSIDESDERLSRLIWSAAERKECLHAIEETGIRIPSMCLSGHRRFPYGSHDPKIRAHAHTILEQAVDLAVYLGIRVIQLAGYDVYYEHSDAQTLQWFLEGLRDAAAYAARHQVMLSMEIMDTELMSSITRFLGYKQQIPSPWFTVYPDLGNLTAWGNDVEAELEKGISLITAIHLKDTRAVTDDFPGQFRDVPFGSGCVDFPRAFEVLSRLDYHGPLLIEMWTEKSDDPEAEIGRARRWMIDAMREGGYITG